MNSFSPDKRTVFFYWLIVLNFYCFKSEAYKYCSLIFFDNFFGSNVVFSNNVSLVVSRYVILSVELLVKIFCDLIPQSEHHARKLREILNQFSDIVASTHRQFGQRQFSQFEIQRIQPKVYRQFSQFWKKTLDSKEKNGIEVFLRSQVSALCGDKRH